MEVKELLEKLDQHKDTEEVQQWAANAVGLKGVQSFLAEDEEGKKFLQAEKDRAVSKGIETWKEKTLPGILDQEREKIRKELNPEETPEQKEIRKLRERVEKAERDAKRQALRTLARDLASEKNLPAGLADKLVGNDEESITQTIEEVAALWASHTAEVKNQYYKENGREPQPSGKKPGTVTPEQFAQMGVLERVQLKKTDPDTFHKLNNLGE